MEDGIILCELIHTIRPGCIRKINRRSNPIAHLDNVRQFLGACKELGLKDAQLFDVTDLQPPSTLARKESSNNVLRRSDAVRRIRSVCVTLFWLGNVASMLKDYTGPQLDLKAFKEILAGGEEEAVEVLAPRGHRAAGVGSKAGVQSGTNMEAFTEDLEKNISLSPEPPEVKFGLTFEQEQTADQLLADIQNAVDEMLNTYKPPPTSDKVPPERSPTPEIDQLPFIESPTEDGPHTTVTINMRSRNGGFGCQIVGGADSETQAKVELVVPGSPAEVAGLLAGDCIVSIGGINVEYLSHMEIVDLIRKGGAAGGVILSVVRSVQPEVLDEQNLEAPVNFAANIHDIAHSAEHSLDSLEWAQTINVGATTSHQSERASIGSNAEEGKRDSANMNGYTVQSLQQSNKEDSPQPVQPAATQVELANQFQKPSSPKQQALGQQSAPSKTIHVVRTSWASSAEQPQQLSLRPRAESTFSQRGGGAQEAASNIRKLAEGVASMSLDEETRVGKYALPKVASLHQMSGAQEIFPQTNGGSQSSQTVLATTPPQSSGSSYKLSALSSQAVTFSLPPLTSQSSQNASDLSQVAISTLPQASQYFQKVSAPSETSAPLQSIQTVSPPQTFAPPPQSGQLFETLQSGQTFSPPQTSGAPQVGAPPSSLSLSPEVEHHGSLTIQKVQRTRWTPKSQTDAQRGGQSHSEASTPAKTPSQSEQQRQPLDLSAGVSGGSALPGGTPPAGGSLHRNERTRLTDHVPLQSSTPTHPRPVQRSMSDRRQHVIQQIPPQQQQPPKQQLPAQVALVSHGLYATVTYKQDACTRCRRPLQQPGVAQPGFVMTVASHKLQYHITCFNCAVCRTPLSYDSRGESTVLIQRGDIHCKFCSSNNQGTKTTEC